MTDMIRLKGDVKNGSLTVGHVCEEPATNQLRRLGDGPVEVVIRRVADGHTCLLTKGRRPARPDPATCVNCHEWVALKGDRCRECDIAHLAKAMQCPECGNSTDMNEIGKEIFGVISHVTGCSRGSS